MNVNRAPKPYGMAYQRRAAQAAIEAGCKGNEMGILYCLFTKIDFDTGATPELAHMDLGADMGGVSFNTVRKCIGSLRKAGIIRYADYRGRGVKWADNSGHANRYQMAIPPLDPVQNLDRGVSKKDTAPCTKNVHHYSKPIYPNGNEDTPSRREGDKLPDSKRGGALVSFDDLLVAPWNLSYANARIEWDRIRAENAQHEFAAE